MICGNRAKIIVIAFDRYTFPSIKDTEHQLRGMRLDNFNISGPDQVRPNDFTSELKNINFKEALVQFIISHWAEDYMAPYIGNKVVYVNSAVCYKYIANDGKVIRTFEQNLTCPAHEEADTKIIFHICQLEFDAHVMIRCSDTDVLIIMLANISKISKNIQISMEVGVGNHQRYINVTKLYYTLGSNLCAALPAYHAITGCDFNPAFFRKGKKRPFEIMRKSADFVNSLIQMSTLSDKTEEIFPNIEEFICKIYGFKQMKNVNEARVATFMKTYKVLDNDDVFRLPKKNIDGSTLPPCKAELLQQFFRACYIAKIWTHAHLKVPNGESPSDYGWIEVDNKFNFTWFTGNQLPTSINEITIQPDKDDDEDLAAEISDSDSETESEGDEPVTSQSEDDC